MGRHPEWRPFLLEPPRSCYLLEPPASFRTPSWPAPSTVAVSLRLLRSVYPWRQAGRLSTTRKELRWVTSVDSKRRGRATTNGGAEGVNFIFAVFLGAPPPLD